ncbi:MAG: hypothetical protein R3268_10490, partial [Acidiferrobacterales bacterium]|nr:hypothetical protein [Acidiferrobacterales bacterium]
MNRNGLLGPVLAFAALTGVHVYVGAQGTDYSGFLLFLDHLFDITIVLILLALCAAVGKLLLTRYHYEFDRPLETLLFSVAIGCGVTATAILILGFLASLQAPTLTALLLFFAVVSRKELLSLPGLGAQAAIEIKERVNILSLVMVTLAAAFLICRALLPPTDWDSLVYHLRVPAQFL